jgi:hypothetical protein
MYTIDSMIQRLQELREIAPDGGNTPVVVHESGDAESYLEPAAIDLQCAKIATLDTRTETPSVVNWYVSRDESQNTCQVVRVF